MDKEAVWFIRQSVIYFLLGTLLGVIFLFSPDLANQDRISLHVHMNLIGWMSMMIFGVGYHILPRFSGKPIFNRKMMTVQFWLASAGMMGMAIGWLLRSMVIPGGNEILIISGVVMFISIILFVYNMLRTVQGP